jgi:HAD superfamily hydrolase (TIGR01509 family)
MDGTLTKAIHDFDAIRDALGIPQGKRILEAINQMPSERAEKLYQQLDDIEMGLISQTSPQDSAFELLSILHKNGSNLGVLTRNNTKNAQQTLFNCGFSEFFDQSYILGRESVVPKPDPDGIHQLLDLWSANPDQTVMVGDHAMDIEAGLNAGTLTIFINSENGSFINNKPDLSFKSIDELLMLLKKR